MVVFHGSFPGRSSACKKSPRWNTFKCDWRWSRRGRRQKVMLQVSRWCGSLEAP
jgi:hypothetical protein